MFTCFDTYKTQDSSLPKEENGKVIKHEQRAFRNWGETVINKPSYTFFPKTIIGISNIVTWAKSLGKTVRVSAYRHTWTNLYSNDEEILISLISNDEALSFPAFHKKLDGSNKFQAINLVGENFVENGQNKHLCKIGSATTNEQMRSWVIDSFDKHGSKYTWTLPSNVVLVENTFGGTNAVACHGAGINNKTLSDLVTEIEFVNPKGQLQKIGYKITDAEEKQIEGRELIKTAAACFGMLGVVTAITVKLNQLTHARMHPVKPRLALTIPPPSDMVLPDTIPKSVMHGVTAEQLKHAKEDFISRCENDYYSEWFWFSLHSRCWVNTWKDNGDEKRSKDYPSKRATKIQEVEQYIAELMNTSVMVLLPPKAQAKLLSDAAMLTLPDEEIITPLIDAIHFKRGIKNMRVQDMEFEIPIPPLADGKPDWSICQRAWWDAIIIVYEWSEKKGRVPMRLPLEMRIMGGSDMTMAPQRGNKWGTCSIEVLTVGNDLVDDNEWHEFMQAIVDKWSSYTDFNGKPIKVKPHWAKQWEGLTIKDKEGKPQEIIDYLKNDVYKDEIAIFKKDLETIATKGGYTLADLRIFSNPLLNNIFYNEETIERKSIALEKKPTRSIAEIPYTADNRKALNRLFKNAEKAHSAKLSSSEDIQEIQSELLEQKIISKPKPSINQFFNNTKPVALVKPVEAKPATKDLCVFL